jgi:gamma-glutamylcyclotransferase (GGCT)/AIG2-like uncharacterized protein YtfP
MADLFTYGTLMDQDIMTEVSGASLTAEPATLKNYARFRVKNEMYPGICPKPMKTVEGMLYRKVPQHILEKLDVFETPLYRREIVTIHPVNGKRQPAYTFVILPENRHRLSKETWTYEWFLAQGKSSFRENYLGFKEIK